MVGSQNNISHRIYAAQVPKNQEIGEIWSLIQQHLLSKKTEFLKALDNPQETQQKLLFNIIKTNQNSEFGKDHNFSSIASYQQYLKAVSVNKYEDLSHYFAKTFDGFSNVITSEKIELFEETAGSSSAKKIIPYTANSIESFQKAIFPWLSDLLDNFPDIAKGKAYFALSPVFRNHSSMSPIPLGMADDSLYFGKEISQLIAKIMIFPTQLDSLWLSNTASLLVKSPDLSFISVWSPTFLILILEEIAKKLGVDYYDLKTDQIWPKLVLISCWTDSNSSFFANKLKKIFPNIAFQGKGLLSTEAVISIPFSKCSGKILAINSNFYEFKAESGEIVLFDGLKIGAKYEVIITNYSGLYRYNSFDKVVVDGFYKNIPKLTFIGRANKVTDLCGEKISEDFVVKSLKLIGDFKDVVFLAPQREPQPHYLLLLDKNTDINGQYLTEELDKNLSQNPQYCYSRKLGQLGAIKFKKIPNLLQSYLLCMEKTGKRIGDIKPPTLIDELSAQYFIR